jgi:ABC-type amino acid transport system permease subunit
MRIRQYIRKDIFKALAIQLALIGMFVVVIPPAFSAAAIQSPAGQSNIKGGSLPDPEADQGSIKTVLQIVFGIIGAFAVLNITLSGLKYVTSAGNEQKTAEAKNGIVYSLVGLMIAISAEAIVAFVITGASSTP